MEPGPGHRRRRPAVACTQCRRRKIRCDRALPCGPCSKSLPMLHCVYHGVVPREQPVTKHQQRQLRAAPTYAHATPQASSSSRSRGSRGLGISLCDDAASSPSSGETCVNSLTLFDLAAVTAGTLAQPPTPSTTSPSAAPSYPQLFGQLPPGDKRKPALPWNEDLGQARPPCQSRPKFGAFPTWREPDTAAKQHSKPLDSGLPVLTETGRVYRETRWYKALSRLDKLQWIIRNVVEGGTDADVNHVLSGLHQDILHPLFDEFFTLERTVQLQHEQACRTLIWASPLTTFPSRARGLLPSRRTCNALLGAYLRSFETVLRVLDVPAFLGEYARFWSRQTAHPLSHKDSDELFVSKLLVILALGSTVCRHCEGLDPDTQDGRQSPLPSQASVWIYRTKQWLARKRAMGVRADIEIAQVMCLLAIAQHTHLDLGLSGKSDAGRGCATLSEDHDLARLGIQMGLHREPRVCNPDLTPKAAEMRRRLWATMLELSLQRHLVEGLPPPLNPDSYDCDPPSREGNDTLDDVVSHEQMFTGDRITSDFLLTLVSTQRLRLRILHRVNSPGASQVREECHRLASELSRICKEQTDALGASGATPPSTFQSWFLDILTRPFILALHKPFTDRSQSSGLLYYSRKVRMESATLLLYKPLQKDSLQRLGFGWCHTAVESGDQQALPYPPLQTPPPACFGSMACSEEEEGSNDACNMMCMGQGSFSVLQREIAATLCADLLGELEEDEFPNLDGDMFQRLSHVLQRTVDIYRLRVTSSGGVHSCREYVLFASCQAYANALVRRSEVHSTVSEAISKACRASLDLCCKVMRPHRKRGLTGKEPPATEGTRLDEVLLSPVAEDADRIWLPDGLQEYEEQGPDGGVNDDNMDVGFQNLDTWAFDDCDYDAESFIL